MALPQLPKKEPRIVSISVRLSKRSTDQLKTLAMSHNMSQADVFEYLLEQEFKAFQSRKKKD